MLGTEVLIVGAGPVGLGLALELGSHGIKCVLVEQNSDVGTQPRAKLTNVRSMELLRRWGLADRLRAASPMPGDYISDVVFATRLNGHKLATFKNAFYCAQDGNDWYSESASWVPQYTLEQVLRRAVHALPCVELRFGTRLSALRETGEGIVAELEAVQDGRRTTLECGYAVGCDGARSTVRQILGVAMHGLGAYSPNINVLFRAPRLEAMHGKGRAVQYWMVNRDMPGVLAPMDREGLWFFAATRLAANGGADSVDAEHLVRIATGLDFPMEITAIDPWSAHRLIAARYRVGRIFLAGDACHLHPPFGGYGMNMGLGDAVDLGWKLAAVLQGWGGRALLDSYEQERRYVHERVTEESVENHSVLANDLVTDDLDRDDAIGEEARIAAGALIKRVKLREFRSLGLVLGYRYKDSPIIVPDGTPPPADLVTEYRPSAHPGCLAPHFWLDDGRSLYDTIGAGFTLLVDSNVAQSAYAPLDAAAGEARIPFQVVRIGGTRRLRDLYEAAMCLVRTDHHVAWRGDRLPQAASALLSQVRGELVRATESA